MPVKTMDPKDLNNGVELPVIAPTGEELNKDQPVPTDPDAIDYEAEYFALLDKEAQTAKERDNYKLGLLKAKGKLPDDEPEELDTPDIDSIIEKKLEEKLSKVVNPTNQRKDELVKKIIAENKELKLALKTKEGISTVQPGSSAVRPDVVPQHWTPEQLAYFKKRGINPDRVKANYESFKASRI